MSTHTEITETTRGVVRSYIAALQRGDLDALRASFTPDATWSLRGDLPVSGTWTGPAIIDGFLAAMIARLDTTAPLTQQVHRILADGHIAVAEWTSSATTRDGRRYENDYAVVFEVRDGGIAAVREYFDTPPTPSACSSPARRAASRAADAAQRHASRSRVR